MLLKRLAEQRPDDEFIIIGRNDGTPPTECGLPSNVVNPWTEWRGEMRGMMAKDEHNVTAVVNQLDLLTLATWVDLDAIIVWAGQHGTSNSPIPMIGGQGYTNPQLSFVNYGSYILRGISVWRDQDPHGRQEIWLCPDPRNYLKARDLKWPPPPILGQFNWKKQEKHYRYGDDTQPEFFGCEWAEPGVWLAQHEYIYSGLEIMGVPRSVPFNDQWEGRGRFGSVMNETRTGIKRSRLEVMQQWIIPMEPDFIHGTWSDGSKKKLGRDIEPVPWHLVSQKLHSVHCTMTAPAVGTGWVTAKPWESFAAGVVCFFHPQYDTQDLVLNRPGFEHLHDWLRVSNVTQLRKRVDAVHSSRETFEWLVREQRRLFDTAHEEALCMHMINERL